MTTNQDLTVNDDVIEDDVPKVWPAFGLPLVEDLPNPIPLEKLADNNFGIVLRRMVGEAIRCNQIKDAAELVYRLRLLNNLKIIDERLHVFYHNLITLLKFVCLMTRKQKDARNLLNEAVVQALRAKIGVNENLQDFLDLYEGGTGVDKRLRRELTYALENNKEQIGEQPIIIEEKGRVVPTLQNWLKDYNASQPLTNGRSKFNQINYLNTNQNARQLSEDDKKILEGVLEMYDKLLFPPPGPEIAPDEEYKIQDYISQQKVSLPPEVFEGKQGSDEGEEEGNNNKLQIPNIKLGGSEDLGGQQISNVKSEDDLSVPSNSAEATSDRSGHLPLPHLRQGFGGQAGEKGGKGAPVVPIAPKSEAIFEPKASLAEDKTSNPIENNGFDKLTTSRTDGTDKQKMPVDRPIHPVKQPLSGSAMGGFNRVNMQDILSRRESLDDHNPGLRLGGGQVDNLKSQILNAKPKDIELTAPDSLGTSTIGQRPKEKEESIQAEIDKKLEKLRKKITK